jgi:hypothetical protein
MISYTKDKNIGLVSGVSPGVSDAPPDGNAVFVV